MTVGRSCGQCRFFLKFFCCGICGNPNSVCYMEYVGKGHFCEEWKKRKEK